MDTENSRKTIGYWCLEYCCKQILRGFIRGDNDEDSAEEMSCYLHVSSELAKLQNPKKADANMTTWLLVAETCVRILQKDFDFEGKNAAFDTFDQFLTYLCKTFKIEDATSNKLINKYNQICYNQMEEEDNDAYHSFIKDVQHIMKIIESKMGKTFLERIFEGSNQMKQSLLFDRGQMFNSLDEHLQIDGLEDQERERCRERFIKNEEIGKITQVEMSRGNVTRKLYNPRRNILDSINDESKDKSSEPIAGPDQQASSSENELEESEDELMETESDGDQGPRQSANAPGKRTAHHRDKSPIKRKGRSKPLEVEEVVSSSQGSAETSDTPDDHVTQTNKSLQERVSDKRRNAPSARNKVTKVDSFEYDSMESNDSILQEANVTSTARQKRRPFSEEEVEWLRRGVKRYGFGNWATILRNYPFPSKRTAVNLKDKWRNIERNDKTK
ncbi:uncharacterized protein LOC135691304 [Rhopilema esculentum]|uniref:uncharacterized protein LOC135691304 n=1 Tax=Rhopilema esculentum TaxID=499914 RepID=UPI0031E27856